MEIDYGRKIIRNTFFVTLSYIFGLAVGFIITPYVIYKLGLVRFGIWSLIKVFFGYLGLLDLGINFSLIRFIAQYYSKKDHRSLNGLLSTGICFNALYGAFILVIIISTRNMFLHIFKVDADLADEISRALLITGLLFFLKIPFKVFSSLIDGLQRFEVSRSLLIVSEIIAALSTVAALELGYKLDMLVLINGVAYFGVIFLTVFLSARIYPEMKISVSMFDRKIFRELFNFGINVQVSQLARTVHFEADKLIMGFFLSPAFVGLYEVGAKINRAVKMIPTFTLFAVLPASSEMHASDNNRQLTTLYNYGSKYMALVNIFPGVVLFALAPQLIYLWLGRGYEMSVTVVRMLVIAYGISTMTSAFGMEVARGMGRVVYERKASILQAVLNVLLSAALTYLYGFKGALWGTIISSAAGSLYYFYVFHREVLPQSFRMLYKNVYEKPLFHGALLCLLIILADRYVFASFNNYSRLNSALYVIAVSSISFFTFSFLVLQSKYFSRIELSKILDSLSPWAGANTRVVKFIYGEHNG